MCGIVGYTGAADAISVLIDGLKKLEYRGYDSSGIATFENKELKIIKSVGKIVNLEEKIPATLKHSCGIGHNRWATHGGATTANAHPHQSFGGKIAVVHNGIIENYLEIKNSLAGYEFKSETDTEVISNLIDSIHSKGNTSLLESVISATKILDGSYAIGVISTDSDREIIAAKKDNPLIIGVSPGANMIASDVTAIIDITKKYIVLDDGEIAKISPDEITIYNQNGEIIKKEIKEVTWNLETAQKDGFDHFFIKEIMEQPKSITNTINNCIKKGKIELSAYGLDNETLKNIKNVHIVACGSAYHAGMVGVRVIEKLARVRASCEVASEFRYNDPIIEKDDLAIIISQSGETADTLAGLRQAKKRGAKTLAIVNVVESTIAREADSVLYTMCGPEISVATTKGYSSQVVSLYMIATAMGIANGHLANPEISDILSIPAKITETFKLEESVKLLAEKYKNNKDIFFLGRSIDFASAQEGSLKLKEVSYIHSEAYPAGELKHGTISLIEPGTLVIGVATQKHLFEKIQSNLKEVAARGAITVLITTKDYPFNDADHIFTIPDINETLSASLSIIPMQFFAYYVSKFLGLDVDKPRNLAKSVTVE